MIGYLWFPWLHITDCLCCQQIAGATRYIGISICQDLLLLENIQTPTWALDQVGPLTDDTNC